MPYETILVVDDEPAIVEVIRERLAREGFEVRSAGDAASALAALAEAVPDLLVLDLMLPDLDGFELLRRVRAGAGGPQAQSLPVIVLTARDDDVDVIVGLELGADDYMAKPFNPRELAARVRAVLRRRAESRTLAERVADLEARLLPSAGPAQPPGGLHFDPASRQAWFNGQLLDLRLREYELLSFLAQHPGQVISRATLLDRVWGSEAYFDERTVDVHIHRLRQKLAEIDPRADLIQTERGVGYRLAL